MTTTTSEKIKEIRDNHVKIIKGLLIVNFSSQFRQKLFNQIIESRMQSLHHLWFGSSSKREKYRIMERKAS